MKKLQIVHVKYEFHLEEHLEIETTTLQQLECDANVEPHTSTNF